MTKSIAKANLRLAEAGEKAITMNALAVAAGVAATEVGEMRLFLGRHLQTCSPLLRFGPNACHCILQRSVCLSSFAQTPSDYRS